MSMTKGMYSSNTDLWSTPQDLYDELYKIWEFNLDVCATKDNAKCMFYYSKEQDGLKQKWGVKYWRKCWMNPPYGREIGKWIKKAHEEVQNGNAQYVIALLPARTDTKWFHEYIYNKYDIEFIKGRLKFGDSKNSAPFPSMIVYFIKEA